MASRSELDTMARFLGVTWPIVSELRVSVQVYEMRTREVRLNRRL